MLPLPELLLVSPWIDETYTPLLQVHHELNEAVYNNVPEVHETLAVPEEVTADRCKRGAKALMGWDGLGTTLSIGTDCTALIYFSSS